MNAATCAILGLLAGVFLCSCETTGDPTQGGIFWSEKKAKARIADRENTLSGLEQDTSRQQAESRSLEGQLGR